MTTILFYFLIILALAGSSYYGWRSAKSAKNRQETQEQKRLRSILLFVNVLLFAGFLSLVITILNDAFILTGHEGLLQQGLRMLLGSGVTVKSSSTSLTLFTAEENTAMYCLMHPARLQSYTLDEICEEIGISRRSLCYVLKKWRKEGILKGKEKRDRIADHEQLMQIAEHIRQFYDIP